MPEEHLLKTTDENSNKGWSGTPGKQWAFFSMVMILKDVVSSRIVSGNIDCATWKTVTRPTATALGFQELELPTNNSDTVLEGQEKNLTSNTSELPLQLSAYTTSTHHRLKFVHPPRPKQKVMWGKLMEIEKLKIFKQHSQHCGSWQPFSCQFTRRTEGRFLRIENCMHG